jgi:hypothetical protein
MKKELGDKPGGKEELKLITRKNPRLKGPAKTPVVEKVKYNFGRTKK